MSEITTITTKGQVTIPQSVRQAMQIKIGDRVSFAQISPFKKQLMIRVIPSDTVEKLFGSLHTKVKISDYKKARLEAGKLLVKKYKVS